MASHINTGIPSSTQAHSPENPPFILEIPCNSLYLVHLCIFCEDQRGAA